MALPALFKGESIVRLLQGTVFGAVLAMVVGFNWGGWTLGSTSARMAEEQTSEALVTSLAPICVNNFQTSSEADTNLAALVELSSYKRTSFIKDGGWDVLPGSDKATDGVAKACASLLAEL